MANQNNFPNLEENQDGTLKGGFVSVTGGRHKIIVTKDNNPSEKHQNGQCNSSQNTSCENLLCNNSKNANSSSEGSCENFICNKV